MGTGLPLETSPEALDPGNPESPLPGKRPGRPPPGLTGRWPAGPLPPPWAPDPDTWSAAADSRKELATLVMAAAADIASLVLRVTGFRVGRRASCRAVSLSASARGAALFRRYTDSLEAAETGRMRITAG